MIFENSKRSQTIYILKKIFRQFFKNLKNRLKPPKSWKIIQNLVKFECLNKSEKS